MAGSETGKGMDAGQGRILSIQRMSTEDGPGIRTAVFLKGCPLRCSWCQNPEGLSPEPEVTWTEARCIGCCSCLTTCPEGALSLGDEGITISRALCQGCGRCAQACPSTALELVGAPWSARALVQEVAKDRAYFERSGGGVTASGGEPTLQAGFVAEFLQGCRAAGISTALDSCGHCPQGALARVLPHADLVLFDLKEMDPERHRALTGLPNERILENLRCIGRRMGAGENPRGLWIRTPIIPGATDRAENIRAMGEFLERELAGDVARWDLCAFNNLCGEKYARLGRQWALRDAPLMGREEMEALARVARGSGVDPAIVHWSGLTRMDARGVRHEAASQGPSPGAGGGEDGEDRS
jgi:pyruvate formate lyase activating enzyme